MLNLKDGDIISLQDFKEKLGISQPTWQRRKEDILAGLKEYYDYTFIKESGKQSSFIIHHVFDSDKQYDYSRHGKNESKDNLYRMIEQDFNGRMWKLPNGQLSTIFMQKHPELSYKEASIKRIISDIRKQNNFKYSGMSCGEFKIYEVLKENNINFIHQYSIRIDNSLHKFDFAILNNDEVVVLIEYDGQQHYKAVEYFGGIEGFNNRVERDNIKNNYCKANGIPLIRIPYTLDLKHLSIEDLMPETSSYLIPVTKKDEIKRLIYQNLDKIAETFLRDKDEALQLLSDLID